MKIENQDVPALDAFLSDRLYEFNARAIACDDGEWLGAAVRDEQGEIVAGISGHTWAGTCQITHLWVHETQRGKRLGRQLLQAAEAEAQRRGCTNVVLSSHSFQAPSFYEALGYVRQFAMHDHPRGHANIHFAKTIGRAVS